MVKKQILLVSPDVYVEDLWVTGDETDICEKKGNFPPLGLATVAALTPEDRYDVRIWDELVHGVITEHTTFDRHYDLVGVTGYRAHFGRGQELARIFREKGMTTAAGGPGATGDPRTYAKHFDIVFAGEVEHLWATFLEEWEQGAHKPIYHQIGKPELDSSPVPRWDSIKNEMKYYGAGALQTTRGCPYDCEFCDVIYLFGRRQRHKSIHIVMEELRELAKFDYEWIFICDDEFGGDRPYAKELLREIIQFNDARECPLYFSTQMCITASGDPEFCDLLAQANFDMVFVGIESANPESLKGANKMHNLRGDLLENIHKLLSYGIGIRSGMIVGFDQDGPDVFDITYDFIQKACLPSVAINMLKAPLGTRLWMRMMRERRVVDLSKLPVRASRRVMSNIIPMQMSRREMYLGYQGLLERVYAWDSYADRICGFISLAAKAPPRRDQRPIGFEFDALAKSLNLDEDAKSHARRILDHAREAAPHLMRRAKELIVQHARYKKDIDQLLKNIDEIIELDQEGKLEFELATRGAVLPANFKTDLNKILPEVHRRVFVNLFDKEDAAGVLTDAIVEFILRQGEDFDGFGPKDMSLLEELVDRNCAQYNGIPAVEFVPVAKDRMLTDDSVPNIKRTRLVDDLYKSVFQKLTELQDEAVPVSA